MNKIPNRQVICEVLMKQAETDRELVVLCSDSRGSASLTPFTRKFPDRFVEVGIAEQDLVSISAGMAKAGKRPFAASPACFLSARSFEQIKIDVAYSNTNVKLIGISGGVSYGALGMSHHSAQDFAAICALPNMRVYVPSDRFQTEKLMEELVRDDRPAYIRLGRNAVEDVYSGNDIPFVMDQATVLREGGDVAVFACGEMVAPAKNAVELLEKRGVSASVVDLYCLKPFDRETVVRVASAAKAVLTVEEHVPTGGMGSMVSQAVGECCPKRVVNLSLPDAPVVTGTSREVFDFYGLNAEGIAGKAMELIK